MHKNNLNNYKNLEKTIYNILKTKAKSLIYIYLIKKNGAKTQQIIKGTKLHPSTVRETLSAMYAQKLIFREKIKNNNIGKNPFIYFPVSPVELLKRHADEIQENLNKLKILSYQENKKNRNLKTDIKE
ncbi:MAG: TrmB family transcriptional regulator [Thermoplasmatota archaeon]|jgi:predicted DNA-binding transcriptional regulator